MKIQQLLGSSSMTPAERSMGRFMRAPDHPATPPSVQVETPAPDAPAPEVKVPEAAPAKTVEQLYDEEFGGSVDPEEPAKDKTSEEAPPEDPAPEPKKDDEAAPKQENDDLAAIQRERDAARAEADRYRREADELRRANAPKEDAKDDGKKEEGQPDPRPNPDDYEFGEADSKFIEDLSEWKANDTWIRRQREADARQIEEQTRTEVAAMEANWKEARTSAETLELYPDFDQKVTEGAKNEAWLCSPIMTIAIQSSPVGTHVAYELATNAAEAERISGLAPIEQALEMGRLEGKWLAKSDKGEAAPAPANPAVKPSKAPEPPEKRSRGSGGQFASEQDAVYDRMLNEFR